MYALGGAQTEPPWVTEPVETSPLKYRRPERFAFSPKEPPKQVIEQREILGQMANMMAAMQQTMNLFTEWLDSIKKSVKDLDK